MSKQHKGPRLKKSGKSILLTHFFQNLYKYPPILYQEFQFLCFTWSWMDKEPHTDKLGRENQNLKIVSPNSLLTQQYSKVCIALERL